MIEQRASLNARKHFMRLKKMYVVKRSGKHEPVCFDKINHRIARLCEANTQRGLSALNVDPALVSQKVISYLHTGISTEDLDRLTAETAAYMSTVNPEYATLASRVAVSNLHKQTHDRFADLVQDMATAKVHDKELNMLSQAYIKAARAHDAVIQKALDYTRDYAFDYFGFRTLEKSYLLKINGCIVERPQHMYMRCALGIQLARHSGILADHAAPDPVVDIDAMLQTYDLLSRHLYTHATPTLFNAGTRNPQLASCFLLPINDDSIEGIFDTIKRCAVISKNAGGIGVSIHNVRSKGANIAGTNGTSNGIEPMIRVFNNTARYVDQCFPSNTRVYTPERMTPLGMLHERQTVLTSAGNSIPVAKMLKHELVNQTLCDVWLHGAPQALQVTTAHPILVVRSAEDPVAELGLGTRVPEYLELADIRVGDYAVFCVPQSSDSGTMAQPSSLAALTPAHRQLLGMALQAVIITACAITWHCRSRPQLLELCTLCASLGLDVDMKPAQPDQVGITTTVQTGLAHQHNLTLHGLDGLSEAACMDIFLGLMSMCTMTPCPEGIQVRGIPTDLHSSVQVLALRSGQVMFSSAGNDMHLLWTTTMLAWWAHPIRAQDHALVTPSRVVPRYDAWLLVPFEHISMAAPERLHDCLYDLELVSAPHDYQTEYGLVHNGGGKRKGAFAMYIEPWHADIVSFLNMKRNGGSEDTKARDLFYALWVPDLFMRRALQDNGTWSLFCPSEILPIKLHELWGPAFDEAYERLEAQGKAKATMPARQLWARILESQIETGTPYMLYKDACNAKSNQQNLGTITCSNLCTEIIQYSSPEQVAVCNLASIALPKFVNAQRTDMDYQALMSLVGVITRNMNAVIDASYYPLPEMATSNLQHRPIGLGVQGLADVFFMLRVAFTSPKARDVNRRIFKCIYYAAVRASMELARERGQPYASFQGSPASQGRLQPDLWGVDPEEQDADLGLDWKGLRAEVQQHGMVNSLLVAPMPTASTAQILGNVECFEAQTSNLYTRRVLSGEFIVVNRHLISHLQELGLWSEDTRQAIMMANGSVQTVPGLSQDIKDIYKTVWEISQRDIVDMAADRGPYIDQSQSLNIHFDVPNSQRLTSLHRQAWERGLKTGMYYLRSRPAADPLKSTLNVSEGQDSGTNHKRARAAVVCTDEVCTMCSS
jgi:ribonucleoside-diphosphate reductase alpha subunit